MRHLLLLSVLLLVSCKKDITHEAINQPIIQEVTAGDSLQENDFEDGRESEEFVFPTNEKTPSDFIKNSNYEILERNEGYLDEDKSKDVVLIVREKDDKYSNRILLVLIQLNNGGYKLIEKNSFILGPEYNNDDFKINDEETVSISNRLLAIETYSMGPKGNLSLYFGLENEKLKLKEAETYNQGAGGQTSMTFSTKTNLVSITEVNTMEEDMPSETTDYKFTYTSSFSDFDPEDFTTKMYEAQPSE
ncbi:MULTISPECIES: hypothetical protein [Flavobacterium]|nr:hypothetical protein [Flavobacterium sp. N1846]